MVCDEVARFPMKFPWFLIMDPSRNWAKQVGLFLLIWFGFEKETVCAIVQFLS